MHSIACPGQWASRQEDNRKQNLNYDMDWTLKWWHGLKLLLEIFLNNCETRLLNKNEDLNVQPSGQRPWSKTPCQNLSSPPPPLHASIWQPIGIKEKTYVGKHSSSKRLPFISAWKNTDIVVQIDKAEHGDKPRADRAGLSWHSFDRLQKESHQSPNSPTC